MVWAGGWVGRCVCGREGGWEVRLWEGRKGGERRLWEEGLGEASVGGRVGGKGRLWAGGRVGEGRVTFLYTLF